MYWPPLFFLFTVATVVASSQHASTDNTRLHRHDGTFTPDFFLQVTYENTSVACQHRMSVLVNGTLPGPALRLTPGRTSWVRVCNEMEEYNTTMHWHGLSQRTAPFSDGTPVTQWPIAPHQCFDYEIHPEEEDSGTYFYHSHVGFQAVSASGLLVIEDAGEAPYEYDDERAILFQDYYNTTDDTLEQGLTATPFVWSGEVNAVLLNGVGTAREMAGHAECALPVIDVDPGKTYLLRFVGGTAISMVSFGIDGHSELDVVAADGQYTKPYRIDHMQVSPGQRFEALLRTKSAEEIGNKTDYIIQFESKDRPRVFTGFAILRYSSVSPGIITTAPSTPPLRLPNETYNFLEYALEPLVPNDFPTAAQVTRRVYIDNVQLTQSSTIWQMDGLNWTELSPANSPPYLVDIYRNGPDAMPNYTAAMENGGWDPSTLTWPAKLGEVLEIILVNTGSLVNNGGSVDYHPFHMHGNHYYDCGSGNGTYDPAANEERLKGYSPVKRDTTNLYRYRSAGTAGGDEGWRCWRLRVQDAGCWMLHCHILPHMIMGMQSVWIMGEYEDIAKIPYSGAEGYLEFGGTAYGGEDSSPVVWQNWDEDEDENEDEDA